MRSTQLRRGRPAPASATPRAAGLTLAVALGAGAGCTVQREQPNLVGQDIRDTSGRSLWLDSGDCFQGAPVFNMFKGEAEMRALSLAGMDAAVIGNHEFDLGATNLFEQYDNWASFRLLAANYIFDDPVNPDTKTWLVPASLARFYSGGRWPRVNNCVDRVSEYLIASGVDVPRSVVTCKDLYEHIRPTAISQAVFDAASGCFRDAV